MANPRRACSPPESCLDPALAGQVSDPQAVQHQADAVVEGVAVALLELLGQRAVFGQDRVQVVRGGGHALFEGAQAGFQRAQLVDGVRQQPGDRLAGADGQRLGQVAQPRAGGQVDHAAVGDDFPGDDLEQGRFADAIGPHQADPLAGGQGQRDGVEHQVVAVGFG